MSTTKKKLKQAFHAVQPYRLSLLIVYTLVVGLILLSAWLRLYDFKNYQAEISQGAAKGAASEISRFISDLEHQLSSFTRGHSTLLTNLATEHVDSNLVLEFESLLEHDFPEMLNYSVASKTGELITQEQAFEIGDLCKLDIDEFAKSRKNHLNFHPGFDGDHFDIMTLFKDENGNELILFISLVAEILSPILANHNLPDYQIFLTTTSMPNVIDISSEGTRQYISHSRELSQAELDRTNSRVPVHGTSWQLVMVPDESIFLDQFRKV